MIYILKIKHKKTWNSTVVVPRFEAFALPIILEQQREAHAEMYVYLYTFVRRIYASLRGMLQNIPAGHLTLLSSEYDYESCEVSNRQNKASVNAYICNMSVNPPSKNRHNPLAWVHDTKVRIIF